MSKFTKFTEFSPKDYSKWFLLDKLYEYKKRYYEGNPVATDYEFDALEGSIKEIHGKEILNEWRCVGYDKTKHKEIKKAYLKAKKESNNNYNS